MTTAFDYMHSNTTCRGAIALPAGDAPAPGIAIFADIGGVGDHTKKWADRIAAELGMIALAADVYGEGATPADMAEGMGWLQAYRSDPPKLVARAGAALDALKAHPRCDGRIGAIGFCFGGGTVIEIARAGHPLMAAGVSFHGALATPAPATAPGQISARLLVCHGAEDPLVAPPELTAFLAEMTAVAADCQTIIYTGAVHSFTNESADGSMMPGIKYHAPTARRSWNAMAAHFGEVFG
jgi:dienelactone hydrolase